MQGAARSTITTGARRVPTQERIRRHMLKNRLAYLLLLPSLILVLIIYIYPVASGVWQSLHNFNRVQPWAYRFIGIGNYITAVQQHQFWVALRVSVIWTVGGVALSYLLGLLCALLLNEKFALRGFYRTILLLPWVIPGVVSSTGWLWLFNAEIGIFNRVLRGIGVIDQPIYWLAKPGLAMGSVIAVHVWQAFPFMMITILAALSNIPDDVYEAGRIDGGSPFQLFRFITFPLIVPASVIATLLSSITTFNDFGTIWVMTGGGPANATTTIIIQSYKEAFQRFNVGFGTALAVIAMIMMLGVGALYLRLQARYQDIY